MTYFIRIKGSAAKELKRIDRPVRVRIVEAIDGLAENFGFDQRKGFYRFIADRIAFVIQADFRIEGYRRYIIDIDESDFARLLQHEIAGAGQIGAYSNAVATRFNGFFADTFVEVENGFPG